MYDVKVKNKNVWIAPRKIRLVCDLIRNKSIQDSLKILRFSEKKEIAIILTKLVNSGLDIATNSKRVDVENLKISKIFVDEGPTMKRIQPRAQGRAFRIRNRSSHITLELSEE
jgi:large subunit ribosomal protein L22